MQNRIYVKCIYYNNLSALYFVCIFETKATEHRSMKLMFKVQHFQSAAVDAVVDCFAGQGGSVRYSLITRERSEG